MRQAGSNARRAPGEVDRYLGARQASGPDEVIKKPVNPFTYYLRVRYGECDAQRVVFNARYADYVDVATNEFIRAIGFSDALINGDLDVQLVKQTAEWKAPARFDQALAIAVSAIQL